MDRLTGSAITGRVGGSPYGMALPHQAGRGRALGGLTGRAAGLDVPKSRPVPELFGVGDRGGRVGPTRVPLETSSIPTQVPLVAPSPHARTSRPPKGRLLPHEYL